MGSKLFFSLDAIKAQKTDGGSIVYVTQDQVPGFINISFAALKLKEKGFQEPIWHPNAHKMGYCLEGDALVTIRSPSSNDVFSITKGDLFFVPQGHVHQILNSGKKEVVINFALSHSNPEIMHLSKALYSLSDSVFSATFNPPADFFAGLKKNLNKESIKTLASLKESSRPISSRFKFNIESSPKTVLTKGGYLQLGIKQNLPILEGLGVLGFGLNPKGVVEPHWHTNAGELVYIVKGQTRITVLSPDGHVEAMEVKGGQGAFAPASHFHNIENIGNDDVEVIAFFSHAEPDYIGIGEVLGSFSNETLASVFNVTPNYFDSFTKPTGPLVIVPV